MGASARVGPHLPLGLHAERLVKTTSRENLSAGTPPPAPRANIFTESTGPVPKCRY